jgi:hypothetical protein
VVGWLVGGADGVNADDVAIGESCSFLTWIHIEVCCYFLITVVGMESVCVCLRSWME